MIAEKSTVKKVSKIPDELLPMDHEKYFKGICRGCRHLGYGVGGPYCGKFDGFHWDSRGEKTRQLLDGNCGGILEKILELKALIIGKSVICALKKVKKFGKIKDIVFEKEKNLLYITMSLKNKKKDYVLTRSIEHMKITNMPHSNYFQFVWGQEGNDYWEMETVMIIKK